MKIHLFVFLPFNFGYFHEFYDDLGVTGTSQWQYIPGEFDYILVERLENAIETLKLARKLVAGLGRCFFGLMHCLVAEVFELSELEVDGKKVRGRSKKVVLVRDKHFFDAVES
jgi:hypothetical protein